MKRSISIFLVILLIALTAVLLAACGGGMTSEDLTNAYEAYKTADAITLKIEDNDRHTNNIANGFRLLTTAEIAFDAEKGMVFVSMEYTRRNLIEGEIGKGAYELFYSLDGTKVNCYKRNPRDYTPQWQLIKTEEFATQTEAMAYLRNQYLSAQTVDEVLFPTFTKLTFDETYSKSFFANKYTWKPTDNRFKYTYELSFKDGKVTEFTYQHKSAKTGNVDDSRKFSLTIEYSADINVPTDLPTA